MADKVSIERSVVVELLELVRDARKDSPPDQGMRLLKLESALAVSLTRVQSAEENDITQTKPIILAGNHFDLSEAWSEVADRYPFDFANKVAAALGGAEDHYYELSVFQGEGMHKGWEFTLKEIPTPAAG